MHKVHYNHAKFQLFYMKLCNWFTSAPHSLNTTNEENHEPQLHLSAFLYLPTLIFLYNLEVFVLLDPNDEQKEL